jgi:ElaB/YqjD/DUF883 family membrane-anchored ribosome-binding protein
LTAIKRFYHVSTIIYSLTLETKEKYMFTANKNENACCNTNELSVAAHKAGHKLREVIDTASDEARDVTTATIKQVRNNPVQSSMIAAGIGFLTGLLLRRR